jgi:hypothetical protein
MTEDPLTSALTALHRVPAQVSWDDVERRLAQHAAPSPAFGGGRRPGRGRTRLIVALVAAGVLVVGLIKIWPDGRSDPVRTGPQPTDAPSTAPSSPSTADGAESSATTAPATRTLRTSAVVAVTGSQYLVWAGEAGANDASQRSDGFAVDLETSVVSPIPVAPIDPRSGATGVWTGTELIVCCGTGHADGFTADTRSAAAWNPATAEWRTLARPPAAVARSYPASVWTGELMVVMATGPAVATYDPATDTWSEVTAPPAIDRSPEAAWTGSEVVLWDARYGSGRVPPDDAVADRGWRWTPGSEAWEPLPDLPPGSRTQLGSMGWTGSEIVVWGESTGADGTGVGARWRPGDDMWTSIAPSPQGRVDAFDGTPGSQTVVSDPEHGRVLIRALDGRDAASPLFEFDPATNRWIDTEVVISGFHPSLAVANGQLFIPDQATPVIGSVPH